MATSARTDAKCCAIQAGEKATKTFDGGCLFHFCSPTGTKVWRMSSRVNGKAQTAVKGPYPAVAGLSKTRQKRDAIKAVLRDGQNPAEARKPDRHACTLDNAHTAHWSGPKDLSPSYLENERRAYEMHANPALENGSCAMSPASTYSPL